MDGRCDTRPRMETRLVIAIPTRNRADLAVESAESVLRARHPRVDVVISDNSTEPEHSARLERFCAERAGELDYVRPPEPLQMPQHWEWLWQLLKARAAHTHVGYLTDRLVFLAGAIDELMAILDSEPQRVLSYHHDRVEDAQAPVELVQTQWTGRLLELDSRRQIELSSRGRWGDYLPRMLNSVAPFEAMEAIERRFGSVFLSVAPDYCFTYRCLATHATTLYFDRACLIERGMARSAGLTFAKGKPNEHAARFASELTVDRFGATPEPTFETTANAIAQEYCTAREQAGAAVFPAMDWWSYLAVNAVSVDRIEDPEWRGRMRALLRRHGWTRRRSVQHVASLTIAIAGYFIRHPGALARSARRQLVERPPGTPLAALFARAGIRPRVRDDLVFDTTAEAIAHATAHPRPALPYAWHVHRLERAGAIVRSSAVPPKRSRSGPELVASR